MIKKLSIFTITFALVFGIQLSNPQTAHALDLDDPSNILSSILNGVSTGEEVWQGVAKEVLEPAVKALADKMLSKMTESVLNWANGGFDGDPSFVNNWDDFLKGTEHEVISGAFASASQLATSNTDGGDSGQTAQDNWNNYQSGELNTARAVAGTIAGFGSEKFNQDQLNSLIAGEGETLTTLLGSQGAKDAFKEDITVGGWAGYLALADPHNYDAGLQSLVKTALSQKVDGTVASVIQDLQTPQKFLDKEECLETDDITGECLRSVTVTPGNQVGNLVSTSLNKDLDQAKLADGLIGSLVSALGKLTSGLIDGGLNQISTAASGAFFGDNQQSTFAAGEFTSGEYQSAYDVLGINSINPTIEGNSTTINTQSLFNSNNGEAPFLGGPEDIGGAWNSGPQIIIDFNEVLEININNADQEYDFYEEMKQIVLDSKDSAIALDQCLPGPDYHWEKRWPGGIQGDSQDELGLAQTKKMVADPKVNIPGSKHISTSFKNLVGSTKSEIAKIQLRLGDLDAVRSTLGFIEAEIQGRFNLQKGAIDENLVLFDKDWVELSGTIQENLLQKAVDNTYYLLKVDQGETIQNVVTDQNDKAKEAVLNMAWDLWRAETDQEEKNDLRYSFYINNIRLSTDQFVATAQARLAQTRASAQSTEELLSDCLVFKAYVLGTPVSELESIVTSGPSGVSDFEELQNQIANLSTGISETLGTFFLGGPLGGAIGGALDSLFGLGGGDLPEPYTYIDINPHPSDTDIIAFLTQQNELTLLDSPNALFNSTKMTGGGAISQSILGFPSELDKLAYFEQRYPAIGGNLTIDDQSSGYPAATRTNAYSVYEIFKQDNYYVWIYGGDDGPSIYGEKGTLFCQHNSVFGTGATGGSAIGGFGGEDNVNHSKCIVDWYKTSDLDYELVFAGVN